MTKPTTREVMWAEMRPDCYGGEGCDEVVPGWSTYADGDKQGEDGEEVLTLAARTFPPGTRVTVEEPLCPQCGDLRCPKFPPPDDGPLYPDRCDCGFDWAAWTLERYS